MVTRGGGAGFKQFKHLNLTCLMSTASAFTFRWSRAGEAEAEAEQSRAEQSSAQPGGRKLIAVSERRGILPLEGLADTLRPICMSITPTEEPISAPRLSGAVALNIGGEAEH